MDLAIRDALGYIGQILLIVFAQLCALLGTLLIRFCIYVLLLVLLTTMLMILIGCAKLHVLLLLKNTDCKHQEFELVSSSAHLPTTQTTVPTTACLTALLPPQSCTNMTSKENVSSTAYHPITPTFLIEPAEQAAPTATMLKTHRGLAKPHALPHILLTIQQIDAFYCVLLLLPCLDTIMSALSIVP